MRIVHGRATREMHELYRELKVAIWRRMNQKQVVVSQVFFPTCAGIDDVNKYLALRGQPEARKNRLKVVSVHTGELSYNITTVRDLTYRVDIIA